LASATLHDSKEKILLAALHVIRVKGYAATTVDDVCREGGVTKGSFFHHFRSKDEMALAAVEYWNAMVDDLFALAAYHQLPDPLDRMLAYIDLRFSMFDGELADYTCLLGTLVQEVYESHPQLRLACEKGLNAHIDTLTSEAAAAKALYAAGSQWTPESVADLFQVVLQGSFIIAKARRSPDIARQSLIHLKRYLSSLCNKTLEGKDK
jgi:TetR/AcrR family transcriptional regulator, transcriptional repressor for nem operon